MAISDYSFSDIVITLGGKEVHTQFIQPTKAVSTSCFLGDFMSDLKIRMFFLVVMHQPFIESENFIQKFL